VFQTALRNTVVYAVGAIPLGIVLAFALAMLLNTGVGGMAVYRTIYFLPSLIPSVAMAILWLWILNGKSGILNYVVHPLTESIGLELAALLFCLPAALGWIFAACGGDAASRRLGLVAGIILGLALGVW